MSYELPTNSTRADNLAAIEQRIGLSFVPDWPRYYSDLVNPTAEEVARENRINCWKGEEWVALTREIAIPITHNSSFSRITYISRSFEPANLIALARLIQPGDTVLDIGAHCGVFSLLSAQLCGEAGKVFAFEPSFRELMTLNHAITRNAHLADRINTIQSAVSNECGKAMLQVSDDYNDGLNTLTPGFSFDVTAIRQEEVEVTTIDQFVQRHGLSSVDFIKVDVEGMEYHVLDGGSETIKQFRPPILIEYLPQALALAGISQGDLEQKIADMGYHIHAVNDQNADLIPVETLTSFKANNFLLHPKKQTNYYWLK